MALAGATQPTGFAFLFRTDEGVVSRALWWRGTAILVAALAALTLVWRLLAGFTDETPEQRSGLFDPGMFAAYAYLVVFAFAVILIAVSHYNLSAKRWRARGKPAGLAGLLPLSAFLAGAAHWVQPQLEGALPRWGLIPFDVALVAIVLWTIYDLGLARSGTDAAP